MIKHLINIFFLSFFLCVFSSCTIFSSDEVSEDGAGEEDYYAEEEGAEEEEAEAEISSEEEITDSADNESYSADSGDEEVEYIDEEDEDYLVEEQAENIIVESEGLEESEESSALAEEGTEEGTEEDDQNKGFFASGMGDSDISSDEPLRQNIPYKKIKAEPYQMAGFLVNAVYIARSGESIESISNKIFGSDQISQLYAINPHLKARTVKVGDKIYYSSPNRPQDSNQLLFYFEDRGIQPSFYQVSVGENIRQIARQLLGHSNSWKEIWATNSDLQSKGILDSALTVRYWPSGGESIPVSPEQPSPTSEVPDEEQDVEQIAEISSPGEPEEELPEPPSDDTGSSYEENAGEVPPKPPSDQHLSETSHPAEGEGEDKFLNLFSQTDMTAGAALAFIALICAFAIIKKRRKKKEFDYTAANFELEE